MKIKEFIILLLIIGAGIFLTLVHTGKIDLYWDLGEGFIFQGEKYEFKETEEIEAPLPAELHILNRNGTVDVLGTEGEKITIELDKHIWSRKKDNARKIAEGLNIRIKKDPYRIVLSVNREDFRRNRIRTHFTIHVPEGIKLNVSNSHGSVKAEAVGDTDISNRNGGVEVKDIRGKLTLENSYNDVNVTNVQEDCAVNSRNSHVRLTGILGNVRIEHRYGKVALEDIRGDVLVEASHSEVSGQEIVGATEIESSYRNISLLNAGRVTLVGNNCRMAIDGARGDVDIHGRYSRVKIQNIHGNLNIQGKNLGINGKNIVGDTITIFSSYRFVELESFSGKTLITLSNGDITLTPLPLTHRIEAKGDYANITLFWPSGQQYPFEAQARTGDIKWELDEELSYNKENGVTHIKAFPQASGPAIHLATKYGTIRIKKGKGLSH